LAENGDLQHEPVGQMWDDMAMESLRCARLLMSFPKDHRAKIHSINPVERLNGEIKRRTDDQHLSQRRAITGLVGALLLEQNDEWAVQRGRSTLVAGLANWRYRSRSC
jgi:transposase-like protein